VIEDRPYQSALTAGAREFYRSGGRALVIQAATGSGKSHMGAEACRSAVQRGHPVMWFTHRRELIKQVSAILTEYEVDHSYIAAGFTYHATAPLHVCSLDTLRRRLDKVPTPRFIVWDEARHIASETWKLVFERYRGAWHLGLDATPQRNDGRGLGEFFEQMLCGPSMQWLIDNGYLAKYRLFAPTTPDRSGLHIRAGDYVPSELEAMFGRPTVVGDAVGHYRQFGAGKRALVFCVSIKASQHQAEAFRAAGFAAVHLDGGADSSVRDMVLDDFRAGRITIICSVSLFTEGLDVVGVEMILQLRPTQSRALYLQMIGRGMRPAPGKTECLILDACANYRVHGLPTDPYDWQLTYDESKRKAKPKISVRVCPKCFAVSGSRAKACVNCGFEFPVEPRQVDEREGELTEVTPEMVAMRAARREQGRARTLEELQEYGRKRGYHPYWAIRLWQARQRKKASA